jgi:hypothetical protein
MRQAPCVSPLPIVALVNPGNAARSLANLVEHCFRDYQAETETLKTCCDRATHVVKRPALGVIPFQSFLK